MPRWAGRGLETAWFDGALVVVNHRNTPVHLDELVASAAHVDWQVPTTEACLIPHTAVLIEEREIGR